jgi:hypothetical protein
LYVHGGSGGGRYGVYGCGDARAQRTTVAVAFFPHADGPGVVDPDNCVFAT